MTSLSNAFVCLMGIGTVFIGLACIVVICNILSLVINSFKKPEAKKEAKNVQAKKPQAVNLEPSEKSAILAGICACIAEELGEDASNIKVLSFKRV